MNIKIQELFPCMTFFLLMGVLSSCWKEGEVRYVGGSTTFNDIPINRLPNNGVGELRFSPKEFSFIWDGDKSISIRHKDGIYRLYSSDVDGFVVDPTQELYFDDDGRLTEKSQ